MSSTRRAPLFHSGLARSIEECPYPGEVGRVGLARVGSGAAQRLVLELYLERVLASQRGEQLYKKIKSNQNLSGNEIYYTACSLLVISNNLVCKFDCRKGSDLIFFSYEMAGVRNDGVRGCAPGRAVP